MKQRKLTSEEIGGLCLALSHLYHAGIGTGDAFALLAEDQETEERGQLYASMARRADEGAGMAQIFRESGRFPDHVCALLDVGEQVGKAEETLNALASYHAGRARMTRQLRSALLYPAVLLCVLLAVVAALLVWVLPVFDEVYAGLGGSLTGLAGGFLALGVGLRQIMPLLGLVLAGTVIFAGAVILSEGLRENLLKFWRRAWGDKGIGRTLNTARFAQALALGLSSGLTAREGAELAAGLSEGAEGFRVRCRNCLKRMDDGDSLPVALRETGLLSRSDSRLLEVGVRSGRGEVVMEQIARRLLEESELALEDMAGRIEPTLVILLSVTVGAILLSVMLPLMHIMTAIG